MNVRKTFATLTALIALLCLAAATAMAAPLDKIQFIKIAAMDEMAVIKDADGKLRVIKPGDTIAENVTVAGISVSGIVLHEKTDKGTETVMVRVERGSQRIQRMTPRAEVRPAVAAPVKTLKK